VSQLQLSKEEKLHLELIAEKKNNLAMQDQILTAEWNGVVKDFCSRNSKKVEEAKTVNLQTGTVEFAESKKEEKTKNGKPKV
jgi:hypothetical protein